MAYATAGVKRPYSYIADAPIAAAPRQYHSPPFADSQRDHAYSFDRYESPKSRPGSVPPTPVSAQSLIAAPRCFSPDASIVLIGVRGTGKSTLAVIASAGFQRRVIDTDHAFQEVAGQCSSSYRKTHGAAAHNQRQLDVLRTVLAKYDKDCILVCGTNSIERGAQLLLQEYSKTHPVIHIVRDSKSIKDYLKVWDEPKVESLLRASSSIFRACSNYEFYNYTEKQQTIHSDSPEHSIDDMSSRSSPSGTRSSQEPPPGQRWPASFLTLKRAERHFLKFVTLIMARGALRSLESAYPLSHVPTTARSYTYAVSVPLQAILSASLDMEELEVGADAFEIKVADHGSLAHPAGPARLDQISQAFSTVRRTTVVPIIYHVMRTSCGTNMGLPEEDYFEIVRHGLRFAPELATVDLEADEQLITQTIIAKGATKIIGDFHKGLSTGWDDKIWVEMYEKGRRLGCDLIRFTRPAGRSEDAFVVHHMRSRVASLEGPHIPLLAFNVGDSGRTSACFNKTLTSVTHPALQEFVRERNIDAPHHPVITSAEATRALYASFVFDPLRIYVIGAKVNYSLSPAMHTAGFKALGLPHTYSIHQTSSLNNAHSILSDPNYGGSSVGQPYKIEIIALTHSLSRHARAIGAVNTLIPVRNLKPDGSIPEDIDLLRERSQIGPVKALYGENTDWIGIRACIRRGLSPANAVGPRTTALVVGAGGMARATVYALLQLGVRNIFIHNRTLANAEKLVAHFKRVLSGSGTGSPPLLSARENAPPTHFGIIKSREDAWPESCRQPTIIVSCIPTNSVGDSPAPDFTLPLQWFKSPTGGVVVELAYRNLDSPLLRQIRSESHRGWVAMDGLDLLPEQGFAQFELFTGRRAPRRTMRIEVLKSYRDENGETDPTVQARLDASNDWEP
ncbi:quinate pathway repressor protein [Diplodia corticola]|uniref:Quinate pathway repressor protein n=1 Tax=Diplodia corticola TaxID=236234 RepID=A0A1J9QJP6_9PEZI|nr:quinate pathway repressor protein [Diplodia corticola]OJD28689.1 quinate pathway repressor protein [Diplodia corticola]